MGAGKPIEVNFHGSFVHIGYTLTHNARYANGKSKNIAIRNCTEALFHRVVIYFYSPQRNLVLSIFFISITTIAIKKATIEKLTISS